MYDQAIQAIPPVQYGHAGNLNIKANVHIVASNHAIRRSSRGALVDRGANGSIVGNDARVLYVHPRSVNVTGIDNHEMPSLRMVDACAKAISHKGPVILIIRQCAYHGKGRSIISSGQMEYFDNKVFDKSIKCQGRQCIITTEGYYFPLDIISGLPYIKMMPNTDDKFKKLPHVILTDGQDWDPTCLDNVISDRDDWFDLVKLDEDDEGNILSDFKESNFDSKGMHKNRVQKPQNQPVDVETGDYKEPENNNDDNEGKNGSDLQINLHKLFQDASDLNQRCICTDTENSEIKCFNLESDDPADEDGVERIEATRDTIEIKEKKINYSHYRPHFLGASDEVLRMTFRNTTQYATNVVCDNRIIQTINSPNPALNVL